MPIVKKRVTIASGATSEQILQGTTYEYLNPGSRVVVAAQDATGTYEAATNLNFTVNNAEFAKDGIAYSAACREYFGFSARGRNL